LNENNRCVRAVSLLSIAGTDSLGGAGTAADSAVFRSYGFAGLTVETALVSQDSQGVYGFVPSPDTLVVDRLTKVRADCDIAGVKVGMTGSPEIVAALSESLRAWTDRPPVILDTVRASGGVDGGALHQGDFDTQFDVLFPYLTLITPNASELGALTGLEVHRLTDAIEAAERLHLRGARAVLIKGGHLEQRGRDFLSIAGEGVHPVYRGEEWGVDIHGTGCHLSSAIVSELARGKGLLEACRDATAWLHRLVAKGAYYQVGRGRPQFDPLRLQLGFR